jgi:hypothetical protein
MILETGYLRSGCQIGQVLERSSLRKERGIGKMTERESEREREREREREYLSCVSSYMANNPVHEDSIFMT